MLTIPTNVIRVGDDFYLTASSFNSVPGLPILHSKDLVNWKIIGRDYSYLAVEKTSTGVRIVRVICLDAPKGAAEKEVAVELKSQLVYLRVSVFGEAICNFSYSTDGRRFQSVGDIFVAQPGMWIGAKLGLFALAPDGATTHGYAD
jgi:beta-xylosidase